LRARIAASDSKADLEAFLDKKKSQLAEDLDGDPVFLAKSAWEVNYVAEKNPKIRFTAVKERA